MRPLVLVTGATRGIGRAAVVELARRGADVALVGRDEERVREVAGEARAAGDATVYEHVADLTVMDDVRRLAAEVRERYDRLDVLANNAGGMYTQRRTTPDGFEQTLALNHLAPFLLTNLLTDLLVKSAPARVVTTASDAHFQGRLDLADLQAEGSFAPMRTYSTAKLCTVLFTRELARRLEGRGVTATCFHPGVVRTGFGKNDGPLWRAALTVAGPFLRSPERGARSLVWLALAPEAAELNGVYVVDEKVREPAAPARDDELARGLWEESARLVGLPTE